jgi:hypothetical protein
MLMAVPDELGVPDDAQAVARSDFVALVRKARIAPGYLIDIQAAVQEMHDYNRDEFRRLSALLKLSWNVEAAPVPLPAELVASQAEKAGLSAVAKLVRVGSKFVIATIIAAIISGPIQYEYAVLGHWTPPSITQVQEMSPEQMDELSRQIMHQLEQQMDQREHQGDQAKASSAQPGPAHLPWSRSAQPPPGSDR